MTSSFKKQNSESRNAGKMRSFIKEWLIIIASALVLAFLLQQFVFDTRLVPTLSMYPTIAANDRLINSKVTYYFSDPQRGDIVVFKPPANMNTDDDLVKRIIGLPGETVKVEDGKVYINNTPLDESAYRPAVPDYTYPETLIPDDCYFMLGDNRNSSIDSHMWASPFLERKNIIGKIVLRYWPFSRFGSV